MLLQFFTILFAVGCMSAFPIKAPRQAQGSSACDAWKYSQLLGGIQENMYIQQEELQGLNTLQSLSAANDPPKPPANGAQSNFQLNLAAVLSAQQKAIAVREHNQRLADELESPCAMGLAMVARSQVAVMIDAKSLEGGGESDTKMLNELVQRVKDAMALNGENLKMVGRGCIR